MCFATTCASCVALSLAYIERATLRLTCAATSAARAGSSFVMTWYPNCVSTAPGVVSPG